MSACLCGCQVFVIVCFCVPSVRSAAARISMHLSLMGSPVCSRGHKGPTPELNDGERGLVGVVGVFGVSGLLLLYGENRNESLVL